MFNDDTLRKYIQAADIKKSEEIENVLPLYKYGFVMKEEHFRNLHIHFGYQNTIRRYMENRNSLTKEELLCILKHYDITDIPDVPDILLPQTLRVTFVPEAQIVLTGAEQKIIIDYLPTPQVEINIATIPVNIVYIPEAQVVFTVPTTMTFVPDIQITILMNQAIQFVPKAQIEIDLTTIPPIESVLDYAPPAQIVIGDIIGSIIDYVPPTQIEIPEDPMSGDTIYWGVMETASGDPRPTAATFDFNGSSINKIILSGNVGADLSLSFDNTVRGYMVFAIPESATDRNSYRDPNGFDGNIGGVAGPFGNLWPDPELKFNDTIPIPVNYKVYITSFWTQPVEGNYILRTATRS